MITTLSQLLAVLADCKAPADVIATVRRDLADKDVSRGEQYLIVGYGHAGFADSLRFHGARPDFYTLDLHAAG